GRATLADFGIASRAPSEAHHPGLPHLIEGTLAYMSPEQTGRMNRDLDYRTDLYSLGVTLYEMLTGRLPFESTDPLEVIHGHVAKTATAPQQLDPGIPRVLSDLVVRLMAKSAEDRYQSGDGVAADLARCATALAEAGRVSDFPLGQDDVRDHFVIPQRLYGRREEVDRLLAAFERVAQGRAELVLVSGYSGIGKTSLIREIYRSLPHQRGHFIQGKFDQLARDVPYAALAQAFQTLVRQLLSETEDGVQTWRKAILAAVGTNGQVVIDVLPELARLIGEQPEMPPLESTESQVRFNLVFQQFVGAFARAEHPLVLFLDDLQWADAATLSLLPLFLANPDLKGLLIIGAYRDNEVSPSHPLAGVVRDLVARGAPVTELVLPPLNPGHVTELLSDTLGGGGTIAQELGALVFEKTGGNPFFMTQFLKSLYHDGQIALDRASRSWRVDFAAIRGLRTTENVVDLMTDRIQRLGPETQRVLRLAACVGNRFDLATLVTVCERGVRECMADLWPALEGGLVTADEQSYGFAPDLTDGRPPDQRRFRFLHDRVQQAAYALIPEADKRQAHLTVGRLLLARGDERQADWLFDVVNQLNYGAELITEPAERLRLAELNLAAGRKAAASAAFPSAAGYFGAGTALLPEDAWSGHHDLAFALHLLRAESEYLSGRFTEAEARFAALLARCRSPKERTDVYFLMVSQLETQSRYSDAIRIGREGLRTLDVDLPEDQTTQQAALTEDIEAIDGLLGQRPIASVVDAPVATDPRIREALRLLRALWAPAFISTSGSLPALAASRMVRLSLEHGNTEDSAFGYLHHAITVGSLLGQYERGHEFGLLALAINERLKDQRLRAVIHHRFAALVNPWRRPFSSCFTHAREAVRAGLESGNLQVAGYAQFQQTWYGMHVEPTLEGFSERYGPIVDFLAKLQTPAFLEAQRLFLQWAGAHQGRTDGPTSLDDGKFREATYLQTYGRGGIFRGMYFTIKLELLFAHGLVEEAKAAAEDGEPAVEQFFGSIWPAAFAFWHLLTLCAWLPRAPETRRRPVQEKIDRLLGRLEVWS
ncbi:MAG TPA: AAA family ATPase, partial [Gemmatimonadales bacterium]|nr:AAA family ATPase [Gemmatimonadales bacterium]